MGSDFMSHLKVSCPLLQRSCQFCHEMLLRSGDKELEKQKQTKFQPKHQGEEQTSTQCASTISTMISMQRSIFQTTEKPSTISNLFSTNTSITSTHKKYLCGVLIWVSLVVWTALLSGMVNSL